jgi:hypothetical protein
MQIVGVDMVVLHIAEAAVLEVALVLVLLFAIMAVIPVAMVVLEVVVMVVILNAAMGLVLQAAQVVQKCKLKVIIQLTYWHIFILSIKKYAIAIITNTLIFSR